jgi:methylenetetrahydrofolate reductase (NADPH)
MPAQSVPAREPTAFVRNFSLEATRPDAAEIAALAAILPPATPVYLTAVPTIDTNELAAAAAGLRKAGLEPVAHIAARRLASPEQLSGLLSSLRGEADMRRLLVIGGDADTSGPFADALAVIQKGRLRESGIEEIGIGGYPEGHPRIASGRLEAALDQKIAAARAAGLRVTIVSQFSFSPEQILAWLRRLRACGIAVPVRVGIAGPASVTALLRYAKRCGVSASLRGLISGTAVGLIGQIAGLAGPDRIIEALAAAGDLGVSPHYFSFGGTLETARYACDAAAGRIAAGHAMAR